MDCHNCGHSLREGAKFCPKCGAAANALQNTSVPEPAASPDTSTNKCPSCAHINAPDARFCANCRVRLGGTVSEDVSVPVAAPPPPRPIAPPPLVRPTPMPRTLVGRRTPVRKGSRVLTTVIIIVAILASAAGYWWFNRPPGEYKSDNSGLYPINVEGKHGFMDHTGKTVITPQFDMTYGFSEGLAAVRIGNKLGFINTKGVIAITPQFDDVLNFRYGRATVNLGNRYGIIDKDGKYICNPDFQWAGQFSGNMAPVKTADGEVAFVDRSGKVVISGTFDQLQNDGFRSGLAAVAKSGKWGFIDTTGKWVIDPQFEEAGLFADGLAPVLVGGRWGYIDRKGKFAINPQYDTAGQFSEGYAAFWSAGKCGFIDVTGHVVADAKYLATDNFRDGLAAVSTGEGWGFIDTTGRMVISPQYDNAGSFQNGLAKVWAIGKEAYITKTGSFVVNPFPGTTIAAERARLVAEAEKNILGEWTGKFGNDYDVRLTFMRSNNTIEAMILNKGWREFFKVDILAGNQLRLTGISVEKADLSARGNYNLDSVSLTMSYDGTSLAGKYSDSAGRGGNVNMTKSIALMDEIERPEDAVAPESSGAKTSETLIGTWRDENSVTTYNNNGTFSSRLENGSIWKGTWFLDNDILTIAPSELDGKKVSPAPRPDKVQVIELTRDKFVSKSSKGNLWHAMKVN